MSFLIDLTKGFRGTLALSLVCRILTQAIYIYIIPLGCCVLYIHQSFKSVALLCVAIILCTIAKGFFRYIEQYAGHKVAFKLLEKLRVISFENFAYSNIAAKNKQNKSSVYKQLTEDIDILEVFFAHCIVPALSSLCLTIINFVFIAYIFSFKWAIISTLFVIIGFASIFIANILKSKFDKRLFGYKNDFAKYIFELQNLFYEIKGGLYGKEILKSIFVKKTRKISMIKNYIFIVDGISKLILIMLPIVIVLCFCYDYSPGFAIDINLKLYIIISIFCVIFIIPSSASNALSYLPLLKTSAKRIKTLFLYKSDKMVYENTDLTEKILKPDIIFKNFSYKAGNKEIKLGDFSIPHGSKVLIIGKSGTGKTTLFNILLGLNSNYKGEIYLSKANIKDISPKHLRDIIQICDSDPHIFKDTVKNNILLGYNNISEQKMADILNNMGLYERFGKSLKTVLKNPISEISTGQKIRLALSRLLIRENDILLLDEITSALDKKTAQMIKNYFMLLNKTCIFISHIDMQEGFDIIIDLNNKEVVFANKK